MTVCPICRKLMKITTITFDIGEGLEELELETCSKDRMMHVEAGTWSIGMG